MVMYERYAYISCVSDSKDALKNSASVIHKILAIVDFLTELAADLNQRNTPKAKTIDFICTLRLKSQIIH